MDFLSKFSLAGKTALVTGCKRGIGKVWQLLWLLREQI